MITAKIFKIGTPTINGGATYSLEQLKHLVDVYNNDKINNLFVLSDDIYQTIDLDRVAGYAQLHLQGDFVFASLEFIKTPYGKIGREIYKLGSTMKLMPSIRDSTISLYLKWALSGTNTRDNELYYVRESSMFILDNREVMIIQYKNDK